MSDTHPEGQTTVNERAKSAAAPGSEAEGSAASSTRVPPPPEGAPRLLRTRSGRLINLWDPNQDDILIEDIAHSLSNQARFYGHTSSFYSTAQHSLLVAETVRITEGTCEEGLWGLLHDAAEAYLGDVNWALRHWPMMQGYNELEERFQRLIAVRFGLPPSMPTVVHHADAYVTVAEARALMGNWNLEQGRVGECAARLGIPERLVWADINPLPPVHARDAFLATFRRLRQGVQAGRKNGGQP